MRELVCCNTGSTDSSQQEYLTSKTASLRPSPNFWTNLASSLTPEIFQISKRYAGPLRDTAYLDGLRGVAAFLVYIVHHESWAHPVWLPVMEMGYGYDGHRYFACLPVVRILFMGGHFAVSIFFVISGFVLSRSPLKMIHDGDRAADLAKVLSSAMFRRAIRLYTPVVATTFIFMTIWHIGTGVWTAYPPHQANYAAEVVAWVREFSNFSFVFRHRGIAWLTYNLHTWSIPVEYKGSMVVYVSLLALSRSSIQSRVSVVAGLIIYFMYVVDGWFISCFLAGLLLAEFELLQRSGQLPKWAWLNFLRTYQYLLLRLALFAGLWLGSQPGGAPDIDYLKRSPGWYYLAFFIPTACSEFKWFWFTVAAVLTVTAVIHTPWLRRLFEAPIAQYLGRISFSLYLVHGPILWLLADRLYTATGRTREGQNQGILAWKDTFPLSGAGPLGLEFNFLACHLIILPITLYASELATRLIDEPSVRFAQYLYRKTLA
ncbi:acyltransferase family-domain-containing protein [Protomyces lactucae-debilis]|uniref:Acyltransferase family-domain-containing protein n=1 Tax=Protomyces lactucae-debilis TaxID=2754530 RepID=A0A1Y2FET6_PROLT|nr:acyltransferase family-domain-containing protein [Protomyces lactucae-debilis]ORY82458.1 acyltransferase family-domain-containing protein [Protomyces lactucae-debilis]